MTVTSICCEIIISTDGARGCRAVSCRRVEGYEDELGAVKKRGVQAVGLDVFLAKAMSE